MRNWHPEKKQRGGVLVNFIVWLSIIFLCTLLYLVRHPIFRFVGESWIVEDSLDPSAALIVLSDDDFYADRATRAAELFREGKAPVVVASGRRLRPNAGIAELMEHDLVERGVPKDKIVRFGHDADSTEEEAEALAKLARTKRWRKLIVVTSNYHTRRARYIFRRVFPQDIEIRVASAHDANFDPEHWWEKRAATKRLMREFAGMLVALWELHHGSQVQEKTQGIVGLGAPIPQSLV